MRSFSGSYENDAVAFLLKPIVMQDTPVLLKEKLIQSGQKHYSELLTLEKVPSEAYEQLFFQAMTINQGRLALDCLGLAEQIIATRGHEITLVSLLRAGTPIGVLLKAILKQYFNIEVQHYGISIIRDIGLDYNALYYILQHHAPESLVFVDGWTGKGVIAGQLTASLKDFAERHNTWVPSELCVLADLSGSATIAATHEDYLIPTCLLNATISGLVSRSVYDPSRSTATDFHGCVYYEQFKARDLSNYFIAVMLKQIDALWRTAQLTQRKKKLASDRIGLQAESQAFLHWATTHYDIAHTNYIKPGIGEATRVLLRRNAQLLLLQSANAEATKHLRWLADAKAIPVEIVPSCPYQAVALIKEIKS